MAFHAIRFFNSSVILLKHSVFSAVSAVVVASEYLRTKKLLVVTGKHLPTMLLFACSPCNVVICLIRKEMNPRRLLEVL